MASAARSRGSPPVGPALSLLAAAKGSRVVATFWVFKLLSHRPHLPVSILLFGLLLGASCVLLPLQRPWRGKKIGARRMRKIAVGGCLLALSLYLWFSGLRACGPLRTLLLDGAELPLLYVCSIVASSERADAVKSRGVLIIVVAYLLLLIDASGRAPNRFEVMERLESTPLGQKAEEVLSQLRNETMERVHGMVQFHATGDVNEDPNATLQHAVQREDEAATNATSVRSGQSAAVAMGEEEETLQRRRRLLAAATTPADGGPTGSQPYRPVGPRSEVGICFVLGASALTQLGRGLARRLATELGGGKRYFSLSVASATVALIPFAGLTYVRELRSGSSSTTTLLTSVDMAAIAMIGFLWLVLPYYIRALLAPELRNRLLVQANLTLPFLLAAAVEFFLGAGEGLHGFTTLLLVVSLFDVLGVFVIVHGGEKHITTGASLPTIDNRQKYRG